MNKSKRLKKKFFERDSIIVAKELLGKIIQVNNCSGRINEVEAYKGSCDEASHAYKGKTKRNYLMFEDPGFLYVYFTYGMHHCMNITTEKNGKAGAILIRSIIPIEGINEMKKRRKKDKNLSDGPAKLCVALNITKENHNGINIMENKEIFIYDDKYKITNIKSSSRIGIKNGLDKKWRFYY